MAEALSALPLPPMRLQVNNRKLIEGFYRGLGAAGPGRGHHRRRQARQAARRRGRPAAGARTAGSTTSRPSSAWRWPRSSRRTPSFVERVRGLGVEHELLDTGLDELAAVVEGCASVNSDRFQVVANLSLARGLDYYTGTVFEIYMDGFENLRSICSGGRYDALATDGRTTYPGVGISFGVSRTLVPLIEPRAADRRPVGAVAPCWSRSPTRRPATASDRRRPAAAGPRHRRPRSPPPRRSSASRSGTPSGAASPSSGSRAPTAPPTRSRTSAAATRSTPTPTPGHRPTDDLRPRVVSTSSTSPTGSTNTRGARQVIRTPRRRQPARRARRPDRHPRRLGGAPARPRRRRLHRPARGVRRRPGGDPRRGGGPPAARGVLPEGHRRGVRPPRGQPEPQPAHRRDRGDRGRRRRRRGAQRGGGAAVPDRRARRGGRGGAARAPLPRPAPLRTRRGPPAAQRGQPGGPRGARTTRASSRSRRRP